MKFLIALFLLSISGFSAAEDESNLSTNALLLETLQAVGKLGEQNQMLVERIKSVEAVVVSLSNEKWGEKTATVGYENNAYSWTNREAMCPPGHYVAGIKVEYRGTCHGKCDKDGGIIGNINLVCKTIK